MTERSKVVQAKLTIEWTDGTVAIAEFNNPARFIFNAMEPVPPDITEDSVGVKFTRQEYHPVRLEIVPGLDGWLLHTMPRPIDRIGYVDD